MNLPPKIKTIYDCRKTMIKVIMILLWPIFYMDYLICRLLLVKNKIANYQIH